MEYSDQQKTIMIQLVQFYEDFEKNQKKPDPLGEFVRIYLLKPKSLSAVFSKDASKKHLKGFFVIDKTSNMERAIEDFQSKFIDLVFLKSLFDNGSLECLPLSISNNNYPINNTIIPDEKFVSLFSKSEQIVYQGELYSRSFLKDDSIDYVDLLIKIPILTDKIRTLVKNNFNSIDELNLSINEQSLKIAKKANSISRWALLISIIAMIISVLIAIFIK